MPVSTEVSPCLLSSNLLLARRIIDEFVLRALIKFNFGSSKVIYKQRYPKLFWHHVFCVDAMNDNSLSVLQMKKARTSTIKLFLHSDVTIPNYV